MNAPVFRDDIQGLRALAIVAVLLFHMDKNTLPGGFVGVDVFFVISGYLITTRILADLRAERFSLTAFYLSRVRRLAPALCLMMAVTLAAGLVVLPPQELEELGETTLATILLLSNIDFLRLESYFSSAAEWKPLLHTWSLAIEAQCYLAFPWLIRTLWRNAPHTLVPVLTALAVASLALSQWLAVTHPAEAFYLPTSRMFEWLTGALTALSPAGFTIRHRRWVAPVALTCIIVMLAFLKSGMVFPGLTALPVCVATALMLQSGSETPSRIHQWLGKTPLRVLGDMSYSLYLWHWPILALARTANGGEPEFVDSAIVLAIILMASALSWHTVEKPMRRLPTIKTGNVCAQAATLIAAIAAITLAWHGIPERFPSDARALFAANGDINPLRSRCHAEHALQIAYAGTCRFGDAQARPDVAVWGDSHASELAVALGERLSPLRRSARQISASACPPAAGYPRKGNDQCRSHNEATLAALSGDPSITTVILTANYLRYESFGLSELAAGLARSAATLRLHGKTVIVIGQIPLYPFSPPSAAGMELARHHDPERLGQTLEAYRSQSRPITAALRAIPGIVLLEPEQVFCARGRCLLYRKDIGVLYFDRDHPSLKGAALIAERIAPWLSGSRD
ncbi:acyltransferase family protein [Paludibacterium paludis]|uniref:Acyltransferase n=1 Tax=Paludibacterium paludis TaxID=1225769 RepID=A0A918P3X1_9NEIS|nr:acyltransferase family protein [Paludibacterium paludis]GGY17557.1 acyltransferase [Paludibacterium paludis]